MGRRYLVTVWPFTGHIYPNLAIAEHLRRRGHTVAFYTGASARQAVESEGCEFFGFRRIDEAGINRIALSAEGILSCRRKPAKLRRLYRQWLVDSLPGQVADLEEVLASWQPDAIICDPTVWAPFLVLHERHRIPVAVFSLIPACLISGKDSPILGIPLPRPKTWLARRRAAVLRRIASQFLASTRRAASRFRQSSGLPALTQRITDFAASMPLYLVPSSPEFDYQRQDLPPSVRYVGPCLRSARPTDAPVEGLRPELPWVYVSEGTVHLDPHLLRCAAQGLANLPLEAILTVGRHRDPDALDLGPRPLAANIHLRSWVNYDALLPHLRAVVNVGGPSTIMAALNEGVPVVIVPFAWDHPETGWRIRESGAGVLIQPHELTPESLRAAVVQVLEERGFRQNAERLASGFRRLGGAERAANLIEEMLSQHENETGRRTTGSAPAPVYGVPPESGLHG